MQEPKENPWLPCLLVLVPTILGLLIHVLEQPVAPPPPLPPLVIPGPPGNVPVQQAQPEVGFDEKLPEFAVARLGTLRFQSHWGSSLMFSADGKTLWVGGVSSQEAFEVETGKRIRQQHISHRDEKNQCSAIQQRAELRASADERGTFVISQLASGAEIIRWQAPGGLVASLAWSHDGKLLLSADEQGEIRLWEVGSGRERHHWSLGVKKEESWPRFEFAANNKAVAAALSRHPKDSGKILYCWDVESGKELLALDDPDEEGWGGWDALAFVAGDQLLVTASFGKHMHW